MSNFCTGKYLDASGRHRWAVLDAKVCAWYFPKRYGKRAAVSLCNRLKESERTWNQRGILTEVKP